MTASSFIAKRISSATNGKLASLIIRLAIVSTALCVAVMIITSALLRGFKSEITEKIFGFWGHVHVAATQSGDSLFEAVPFSKDEEWITTLKDLKGAIPYSPAVAELTKQDGSIAGVKHVQTYIVKPAVIQTKGEIEGILLKGAGDDFEWSFFEQHLRSGQILDLTDSVETRELILSEQTAARVNLKLGDPFLVHFPEGRKLRKLRFKVGGLYRTGLEEYDTQFAIVDQRVLQRIMNWTPDQVSGVELILENVDDVKGMAAHVYFDVLPSDVYAESVRERFPGIFEWLDLQDLNEYVIIGLMLLVCVINMVTALLILILERSSMVGVLRTMGMGASALQKIFLRFGLRVLAQGLFWGNVIGLGLCFLQKYTGIISLSEENYYLSTAPISIHWGMWLFLNIGTILVVMTLLLLPAMFVTRIDPVKTIRFD